MIPLQTTYGEIIATPIDARTVRLSGSTIRKFRVVRNEEHDAIESIHRSTPDGEIVFSTSKYFLHRKSSGTIPYKINVINQLYDTSGLTVAFDFSIANLTKTSIFVLPFLGENRRVFFWDKYFVNAFIKTDPAGEDVIALLYRFSGDINFLRFEKILEQLPSFRFKLDTDSYHVLYVFDVPEGATSSFEKFKQGKYSEIDEIMKLSILNFHNFERSGHTGQILFKAPSLRRALEEELETTLLETDELCSIPNIEDETFNADYYNIPKPRMIR